MTVEIIIGGPRKPPHTLETLTALETVSVLYSEKEKPSKKKDENIITLVKGFVKKKMKKY